LIRIVLFQIPTDGLILKGWYTTITIALYGTLTVVKPERASPPPPPPPQPKGKAQGIFNLSFNTFAVDPLYILFLAVVKQSKQSVTSQCI